MFKKWLYVLCLLPMLVMAAETPSFKEGVDYRRIGSSAASNGPVRVQEFFSYGCPWCYKSETELQAWLKKKPKNVVFQRVPVIFNPVWEKYARTFYSLEAMGVEAKMTPYLFAGVQDEKRNFNSGDDIAAYLGRYGLDSKQFLEIYAGSPGLEAKISEGNNYLKQYEIFGIPAVVVNGMYITDSRMTGGNPKRMFEVVSYLVKK